MIETRGKNALIAGITGQDGSYMAELLLEKGYTVHGVIRRRSSANASEYLNSLFGAHPRIFLHHGDLTDSSSLLRLVSEIQPDEIYNLAAQSHVQVSFELPEYTTDTDAIGPLRLLETIRILGLKDHTRFFQASSSEMFGKVRQSPQNETTPFYPRSPYGAAKLCAYWMTVNYREAYGIFAANGIMFNHESPRRGETFVTRKITRSVAKIVCGTQDCLYLGNLDAKRDWGYARDYMEGAWRILQQKTPEDFVLATGRSSSVREFVTMAFAAAHIPLVWNGSGMEEVACHAQTGRALVRIDPQYFRPAEVDALQGDATKAAIKLGWTPRTRLEDLVADMVEHDLRHEQAKGAFHENPDNRWQRDGRIKLTQDCSRLRA